MARVELRERAREGEADHPEHKEKEGRISHGRPDGGGNDANGSAVTGAFRWTTIPHEEHRAAFCAMGLKHVGHHGIVGKTSTGSRLQGRSARARPWIGVRSSRPWNRKRSWSGGER